LAVPLPGYFGDAPGHAGIAMSLRYK